MDVTHTRSLGAAKQAAYGALAAALLAVAVFELVTHGTGWWQFFAFGAAPDLALFVGIAPGPRQGPAAPARRAALQRAAPLLGPARARRARGARASSRSASSSAPLAWALHVALDRTVGYGLRTPRWLPARLTSAPRAREIVAAARELLEAEGPEGLSMRRLADRLGIRAPSIYKHLPDKQALEAARHLGRLRGAGRRLRAAARGADDPLGALAPAYRALRDRASAPVPADDRAAARPRPAGARRRGPRRAPARPRPSAATRTAARAPGRSRTA